MFEIRIMAPKNNELKFVDELKTPNYRYIDYLLLESKDLNENIL